MTPFLEKFREIVGTSKDYKRLTLVLEEPLYSKLKADMDAEFADNNSLFAPAPLDSDDGKMEAVIIHLNGIGVIILKAETTPAFKELEQFL